MDAAPTYYYNTPYPYFPPQSFPQTTYPPIPAPRLSKPRNAASSRQIQIAHPYARLLAKKDEVKRRKIWNHALEKFIFSAYEL